MRVNKKGEVSYCSFQELAESMNINPVSRVTKDKNKLKSQQENFMKRHKCRACGQPMSWIGGNMMTCTNDSCRGIKITREDEEGNKKVSYLTSYDLLDEVGTDIANNIFSA